MCRDGCFQLKLNAARVLTYGRKATERAQRAAQTPTKLGARGLK